MSEWLKALRTQKLEVESARDAATVVGWLDTGNFALNWAISGRFQRGYPLGHTVEIFGDPATGKSYLITRAIAMAQATQGVAFLDDTEGAYNLEWMTTLGVDVDALGYVRSRTVSEHVSVLHGFLEAYQALRAKGKVEGPGVLACDSLAQLSTDHEVKADFETPDLSKAKELKKFFRRDAGGLLGQPVVHISTNHVIANVGNAFQKRTTSGGGGPKYQASVRIDLRTTSKLRDSQKKPIGVLCRAFIDKNRLSTPWKEVRLAIPFYQPISRASGLIPVLVELGVLDVQGRTLYYEAENLGLQVYKDKKNVLKQDEEAEKLLDMVPELLDVVDAELAESTGCPLGVDYLRGYDTDEVEDE